MRCRPLWLALTLAGMLLLPAPAPASAYIGPGAGFALVSSAFVLVTTVFVVVLHAAGVAVPRGVAAAHAAAPPQAPSIG